MDRRIFTIPGSQEISMRCYYYLTVRDLMTVYDAIKHGVH